MPYMRDYKLYCLILALASMMNVKPGQALKSGECDLCLTNGVACLDEYRFKMCVNGNPTNTVTSCPTNTVCTAMKTICVTPTSDIKAVCFNDYCGTCEDTKNKFACFNETSYGFCYGSQLPHENTRRNCPVGYVCNLRSNEICTPDSTTIASCQPTIIKDTTTTEITPTVTNSDTESTSETTQSSTTQSSTQTETTTDTTLSTSSTSTTTSEPINLNKYCSDIGIEDYYKNPNDPTCVSYIRCYLLAGEYLFSLYTCNNQYFNEVTKTCENDKPDNCT